MLTKSVRDAVSLMGAACAALCSMAAQPVTANASSAGTLFAVTSGGHQVAALDPVTGSRTVIADFTVPYPLEFRLSQLVSDAGGHRLFSQRIGFSFNPPAPPTYQLVTIDTQTHAATVSSTLEDPLNLGWDPTSATLFGTTVSLPSELFKLDPTTGAETPFAGLPGVVVSGLAMVPPQHSIDMAIPDVTMTPPIPLLVSVDTITGAVTTGPALSSSPRSLAYDVSSGLLFANTTCCPQRIVRVDPNTGNEIALVTFDPGVSDDSLAVDPTSHTLFSIETAYPNQFVMSISESGNVTLSSPIPLGVGFITGLAFEAPAPPPITSESIKADVRDASAGGAIDNPGIATSLLAKLDDAATARAAGECADASEAYQSFIDEVSAQTGTHITASASTKLISEAQFLIANCP
jgi:hypothetical protein